MSGSSDTGGISPGPSRSPARAILLLLILPGLVIAAVSRLRPRLVSMRTGSWLFATLAIWAALLRLPLYGACSVFLAAGAGSAGSADRCRVPWLVPADRSDYALAGLLGLLGVLAALSSGRQAIREQLAVAGLPPPPPWVPRTCC